jgi:iron complex outermembrane receptor protein
MRAISGAEKYLHVVLVTISLTAAAARPQILTAFDLPSEPLADALRAVASQTHSNILFDRNLVQGLFAGPLKARLDLDAALERLLADTSLTYHRTDQSTVIITRIGHAPPKVDRTANLPNTEASPSGTEVARTGPPAASAASSIRDTGGTLAEVVVTAEKRTENLQDTPVAVVAVSGSALNSEGIREFTNLEKVAPEVRVDRVVGYDSVMIRGVNQTSGDGPGNESPNTFYIDNAYLSKDSELGGQFYDINRIEILLGPQGTLYGRNSMGGSINVIVNHPGPEFGGYGQLEFGNYGLQRFEGALNLPVTDTFAIRLAFASYKHGGYFANGMDDADEQSERLSAQWTPNQREKFYMSFDRSDINANSMGVPTAIASPDPRTIILGPFDNTNIYGSNPGFYWISHQPAFNVQNDYSSDFATWTVQATHREERNSDIDPTGITSVNAAGQLQPAGAGAVQRSNLTTLETRLTSISSAPFQWIAGAFAMRVTDSGFYAVFGGAPANVSSPAEIDFRISQYATAYAAFLQGTYTPEAFSNKWHFIAGARYSKDIKVGDTETTGSLVPNPEPSLGEASWAAPTWRLAAQYGVSPASMLYASVSRGYSAGGYSFAPPGASAEFKSQYVTSYEVGSKNRFLDNRLQVNVDAYYSYYKDYALIYSYAEITPTGAPAVFIGDANGDVTFKGGTIDVQYAVTPQDRLKEALTYLWAYHGSDDLLQYANNPTAAVQLFPLHGTRVTSTPPWTNNLSYDHTFQLKDYTLDAALNAEYRDAMPTSIIFANTPREIESGPSRLLREDFLLRLAPNDDKWDVTAYVRNLTNEVDYATISDSTSEPGILNGLPMPPRTYGMIVAAHF